MGGTRIILRLSNLEVVIPFCIVSYFCAGYDGENLREVPNLLDPDGEIDRIGDPKNLVVAIKKRVFALKTFDMLRRFSLSVRFIVFFMESGLSYHASRYSYDDFSPLTRR